MLRVGIDQNHFRNPEVLMDTELSTNPMLYPNCSSPQTQPTCQKCFSRNNNPSTKRTKEWRPQPNISTFRIIKERRGEDNGISLKIPVYITIQLFQSLISEFFHRQNNKRVWRVRAGGGGRYLACTILDGNRIFQAVLRDGLNLVLGIK
ncbi:hypothetical protein CDAR_589671 [Caerostris darwini]|uniref:LAGLIDADG homing endonuclease n=1 Tax=Caerostris darwini TaxID=1538125 RepID=A0AAV4PIJ7_9ARAC|nr:hypothetical protein CDAR_589671 [Caerostris darwini]